MAETSIAWCDYTFNGWIGCEKVSPACRSCYASVDTYARVSASRGLPLWGPDSTRHVTSVANWRKPLAWDRKAASMTSDHKPRVFAHSLSDIGEDRRDLDEPRAWLSELIRRTRNLQWLLLTKRPENLTRLFLRDVLELCWVGTTAEDQPRLDERCEHLRQVRARVRFLSVEPMLGPLEVSHALTRRQPIERLAFFDKGAAAAHGAEVGRIYGPGAAELVQSGVDWVICGSESGPRARPFRWSWAEALRAQCADAGVAFFMKQGPDLRRGKTSTEPSDWPNPNWPREWPR